MIENEQPTPETLELEPHVLDFQGLDSTPAPHRDWCLSLISSLRPN